MQMKKKECPSCAMQIDETKTVCPICSFEFPTTSRSGKWLALLLLAAFLLAFLGGIFSLL